MVFNSYTNPRAEKRLEEEKAKPHGPMEHLVQLGFGVDVKPDGTKVVVRRKAKVEAAAGG
jgi:hypothetical protein